MTWFLSSDGTKTFFGIYDPSWMDWIDGDCGNCDDPWFDWLGHQCFPIADPTRWFEPNIRDLFKAADALRLAMVPRTEAFRRKFAEFRELHEGFDFGGKALVRFMIWRAAALKALWDHGQFKDCICCSQIRDTLIETLGYFGFSATDVDVDGNYGDDSNFWRPTRETYHDAGRTCEGLSPTVEYRAIVLSLMRQAIKRVSIMAAPSQENLISFRI